jgi:hypothetical protein
MRFMKILAAVVVLALVVEAGLYYVIPNLRPRPALALNIKSSDELTRRVLQKFPLGSSATTLKAELEKEGGWSPIIKSNIKGEQFVFFSRPVGLLTTETTMILWKSDEDDRLIDVRGSFLRDSAVP